MDATQDDERTNGASTLSGPHEINPYTLAPYTGPLEDVGRSMQREQLEREGKPVPDGLLPRPSRVHRSYPSPSWAVSTGGALIQVTAEDKNASGVFPERTIEIVQSGQTIKVDKASAQLLRHALRAAELWEDEG